MAAFSVPLVSVLLLPSVCYAQARRGGFDEVGLLQVTTDSSGHKRHSYRVNQAVHGGRQHPRPYQTLSESRKQGREIEAARASKAIGATLANNKNLSHSAHIWKFISGKEYSPSILEGGCLYLPSDQAWKSFYHFMEHPYPPLFAEMIANAFYPQCGNKSMSGMSMEFCANHRVKGSEGCFSTKLSGNVAESVQIYETEGHVGLPGKWKYHIDEVTRRFGGPRTLRKAKGDQCSNSKSLPGVPKGKQLVIPTRFVVCSVEKNVTTITRKMIRDQAKWMNVGYAGNSPWHKEKFDKGPPPEVDMQIRFDLKGVEFVQDSDCAKYSFIDTSHAAKYNKHPGRFFTVVIVSDDESGILGMSEFPTMTEEGDPKYLLMISTFGLRHWVSHNKNGMDMTYDEGDTATHEAGHSLGLYHTFEGGCEEGDEVSDTEPEMWPMYTCDQENSCQSPDPVHNFMDYSPDECMNGFTTGQKRRAWCIMKKYRPKLFGLSLQDV